MNQSIKNYANNCTLVALQHVLADTVTDQEIVDAALNRGWVPGKGMTHYQYTRVGQDLGLRLKSVELPRYASKAVHYKRYDPVWDEHYDATRWVTKRVTLAEFCKMHPKGVFFVSTRTHALVVRDGVVWDPNCASSTMGRGVESADEVLNPPEWVSPTRICWLPPGKRGTKTHERRQSALLYIKNYDPLAPMGSAQRYPTAEEIIANTAYTKADYEWDLARGSLRYAE